MGMQSNMYNVEDTLYPEVEDLSSIVLPYNLVVIKPSRKDETLKTESGLELQMAVQEFAENERSNIGQHVCVYGEVIVLPKHLSTVKQDNSIFQMTIETEVECEVGDTVYYHFNSDNRKTEPNNPRAFMHKGEEYIYIPYRDLFCGKRKDTGELYCMNDFLLFEPIPHAKDQVIEKMSSLGLSAPDNLDNDDNEFPIGRLAFKGKRATKDYEIINPFNLDIEKDLVIGQKYLLEKSCNATIEVDMHSSLDKVYWRVLRKHVVGVVE